MRLAAVLLRFAQRSGLQALARKTGLLRLMRLEEAEALAPPISRKFFVPRNQLLKGRKSERTVLLHAGCVMHVAFAEWDEATARVLQCNGCDVIVPADQGCCGAIAVHAGELDFGRELAKRNIEAFERSKADYYIINAAGCGSTLKEYGHLLKDDPQWGDRAARFSSRVRDVLEFLDEIGLSPEMGRVDAVVTYQDACHLAHAQRITAAPRRLLAQIPGVTLREMRESSVCCGSAGIYNVTQPEMARRLGTRKAENVAATGAEIVATANPGCALQMRSHLREKNSPMNVNHVIELLDRAYANYIEATSRSRSFSAASSDA
jgi:glycolate oxidase iron-sulfur subunit